MAKQSHKNTPTKQKKQKRQNRQASAGKKSILKMVEFKVYVDLYKFFLKMCLSVNVFYLGLLGGLLTFLFRPVDKEPGNLLTLLVPLAGKQHDELLIDTLIPPVKVVLLVTPFLIGYVLMLSFAMGGAYWLISTRDINRHIKNKSSQSKNTEVELITTPFFHLLTFLLFAVVLIFMLVAYFLGIIMEKYEILFCEGCYLPRASLILVIIAPLIILIMSLLAIRLRNKAKMKLWRRRKGGG
ncbi:MAG: hypothetical protein QOD32_3169 [Pyrinomonadaceae bacterium]|jgi:ABC-type multidrug transport system fused ATPase/permease subunit|nr:hypothetical protein [Pyrinomonadaceae bacterium]